jgi:hypothetical protein
VQENDNKNKSFYGIPTEPFGQQDPWTLKWDFVIILFAIFNAIGIPLSFGFPDIAEAIDENRPY